VGRLWGQSGFQSRPDFIVSLSNSLVFFLFSFQGKSKIRYFTQAEKTEPTNCATRNSHQSFSFCRHHNHTHRLMGCHFANMEVQYHKTQTDLNYPLLHNKQQQTATCKKQRYRDQQQDHNRQTNEYLINQHTL